WQEGMSGRPARLRSRGRSCGRTTTRLEIKGCGRGLDQGPPFSPWPRLEGPGYRSLVAEARAGTRAVPGVGERRVIQGAVALNRGEQPAALDAVAGRLGDPDASERRP